MKTTKQSTNNMQCKFKNAIAITGGIATGKSTACSILKLHGYPIIDTDLIAHEILEQSKDKVVAIFGDEILVDSANLSSLQKNNFPLPCGEQNKISPPPLRRGIKGVGKLSNQTKIAESNAKNTHPLTPSAREGGQNADSARINRKQTQINRKKLGAIVFGDKEKLQILEAILHPKIRECVNRKAQKLESQGITYFIDIPLFFELQERGSGYKIPRVLLIYAPFNLQLARIQKRDNLSADEAKMRLNNQIDIEKKREKADFVIENTGTVRDLQGKIEAFLKQI